MTSIVVTGFARQAEYLADLLTANLPGVSACAYDDSRSALLRMMLRALRADASITFGGREPKALLRAIFEARSRPVIHLWAGTDVVELAKVPQEAERLLLLDIIHWAVSPGLAGELAPLGIDARCVAVASAKAPETLAPLPGRFTVLTYLPQPRREFYGQHAIWQAARGMPDVRFVAIGAGGSEPQAPPNVEYTGEIRDVDERIDSSTVLVRMTQHDGLPQGIIEALVRGRHVIWTHRYPGCIYAEATDDLQRELQRLYALHKAGLLGPNYEGARYARTHHDPASVARHIFDELEEAISQSSRSARGVGKTTLAISGLPAFSSRVAVNLKSYNGRSAMPALLATHTNTDAALSLITLLKSKAWYSIGQPAGPRSLEFAAYAARKRRIIHWLGNDVELLEARPETARKYRGARFVHLAPDEEVARRLKQLGLHAAIASLPALPRVDSVAPLPARFTLLLYLPAERPQLYGKHQYEHLMRALAGEEIHYMVVGGGAINVPTGVSAEILGWRYDLAGIYERSSALARFTQSDSFSAMVVEALLHGRHVLWSNDFPYVTRVRDFRDLETAVRSLLSSHRDGSLAPCYEAASEMRALYSPDVSLKRVAAACGV